MKKNVGYLLGVLLSVFVISSCTDVYKEADAESEEVVVPPGETYTAQRKYTLNVVYYVPADMMEFDDWHYRLSGITLHMQNYFYENINRYMHLSGEAADKFKFGLEVNDVNPDFVKIHFIKSTRNCIDMREKNLPEMAQEVLDYFNQRPELKKSNHYLVYMPAYEGSFVKHYYPSADQGMVFAGSDTDRFKIKYFDSPRARASFLYDLGYILKAFCQACFVPESNSGLDSPFLSLMGSTEVQGAKSNTAASGPTFMLPSYNCLKYTSRITSGSSFVAGTPDKIRLMVWDAMYLKGTQLFNDDYSYDPFDVTIDEVQILSKAGIDTAIVTSTSTLLSVMEADTLHIRCSFSTMAELSGVVLFDDPWRTYEYPQKWRVDLDEDENYESGWDAYGMYVSSTMFTNTGGNSYVVDFTIPMANFSACLGRNPRGATEVFNRELRFRFIGKNGMAYPHVATSLKGAFEPPLRNVYEVTSKKFSVGVTNEFVYLHDIATRYGTWEEK